MSSRTCPDWPELMELAPELQFKHYTVAEAQLPADALMRIPAVPLSDVAICCDLDHNVFYAAHTDERVQLLGGEPFALALEVVADDEIPPPLLGWELRDDAGVLVTGGGVSTAGLGWAGAGRALPLRFEVERPPFADGRLHIRLDLTDESGQTQYHSLDDARVFVVYPADDSRGLVRVEGRWTPSAELERA